MGEAAENYTVGRDGVGFYFGFDERCDVASGGEDARFVVGLVEIGEGGLLGVEIMLVACVALYVCVFVIIFLEDDKGGCEHLHGVLLCRTIRASRILHSRLCQ